MEMEFPHHVKRNHKHFETVIMKTAMPEYIHTDDKGTFFLKKPERLL